MIPRDVFAVGYEAGRECAVEVLTGHRTRGGYVLDLGEAVEVVAALEAAGLAVVVTRPASPERRT